MTKTAISVTDAARNFADCINRAHYQNVTFVLLKNGSPVARLTPDNEKVCSGRDLAEALEKSGLRDDEAKSWRRDLKAAGKTLNPRLTNGDNPRRRCDHWRRKRRLRSPSLGGLARGRSV